MDLGKQIAKHLKEVYFGGNWTAVNYKDSLGDVNHVQATTKVYSFNTIATLVVHTGYYVDAIIKVLKRERLTAKDELSFDYPPIQSQEDWEKLLHTTWANAEQLIQIIEQLQDTVLWEDFTDKKYGNYYRNLSGIIEHLHYHLGQIVLIKKIIQQS